MLIQRRPVPILSPFTIKMTIFIILGFNYVSGVSLGKCKKNVPKYSHIYPYTHLSYVYPSYTQKNNIVYTLCSVKVFDNLFFSF